MQVLKENTSQLWLRNQKRKKRRRSALAVSTPWALLSLAALLLCAPPGSAAELPTVAESATGKISWGLPWSIETDTVSSMAESNISSGSPGTIYVSGASPSGAFVAKVDGGELVWRREIQLAEATGPVLATSLSVLPDGSKLAVHATAKSDDGLVTRNLIAVMTLSDEDTTPKFSELSSYRNLIVAQDIIFAQDGKVYMVYQRVCEL